MEIDLKVTEEDIKEMVVNILRERLNTTDIDVKDLKFQVRSKQNYRKQEWESGEMRVTLSKKL